MATVEERIELQATKYMRAKVDKDNAEESMDGSKDILSKIFSENDVEEHLVRWDNDHDIKVKFSSSRQTVFDKEGLASELNVEASSINTEFLLRMMEKGELSLDQYRKYCRKERKNSIRVRLVKVK